MLSRAFGARPPPDLKKLLIDIGQLVLNVSEVRGVAVKEQRKLEDIDKRGRDGRQRFGFAVDALGIDLSKAKDEVRAAQSRAAEMKDAAAREAARYAEAQRQVIAWEGRCGGQEPSKHLAKAYRECADIVDAWTRAREEEHRAHARIEEAERNVGDIEYQIRELRTALANHEKHVEAERSATEATIIESNTRAEQHEKLLLDLASRFTAPLRTKPELGALFQKLESDVAA
jgi:serine/threonine-protein kinase